MKNKSQVENALRESRETIDLIDKALVNLFAKRFLVAQFIATCKKKLSLPIADLEREKEVIENVKNLAKKADSNVSSIERIFTGIIDETKHYENNDISD